ncbi:amidohydrolase [Clostridium swellfunianum]|uniref:amidohydrolase n=1 Tax=Clostridium swellfunianum TaxID=1367462 RepID=UPI00202DFB66|nr:amidohydrolase [Clostridium swellfunianum]MCM0646899.1 amidohydrolase [Clostridium swellfunianum]
MAIYFNGNIITLEENKTAEAFCIRNGSFLAVGSEKEILKLKQPNEELIDLMGRTIVPGFNDSHMHFLGYAVFKSRVNLSEVSSIDELIEKTKQYIKENNISKGEWVISRGWNDNHFKELRLPNRFDLDKISTDHPIFFSRVCGHIGVANSKALELCNITSISDNPEGGIIDKENNQPTGILRENAMNYIFENLPSITKEDIKKVLKSAFEDALSCGLTTIHTEDMGTAGDLKTLIDAYKELETEKHLPLRFVLQLNLNNIKLIEKAKSLGIKSRLGSNRLNIGVLKLYQDGSLGGRTAAMEKPYEDADTDGVTIYSQEELDALVLEAHRAGFQIAIHAIGDRAMRMILDSYEKVKRLYPNKDLRPIIIHCQFTNKDLLERFRNLGVVANVQPSFVMTDFPIVEKAVGKERAVESYNWKTILDMGINVSFSSDAPIESFNPLYGIHAAVTRKDLIGSPFEGWYKEQCISVEEALKAFTLGSAYANFEETIKGSIAPGKLADFVVLSDNILSITPDNIKDIVVLETYVDGKQVYKR